MVALTWELLSANELRFISKMPGVKSIGPPFKRVKGRMVTCAGCVPPKAWYSVPRADSFPIRFGYVLHRPVGLTASWALTIM